MLGIAHVELGRRINDDLPLEDNVKILGTHAHELGMAMLALEKEKDDQTWLFIFSAAIARNDAVTFWGSH